ncbi:MAG: hypothetical protein ABIF71_06125 [Planctomycetota bacterium]
MTTNMRNQAGSALIIAMMVVVFLVMLAAAVMDPVSSSHKIAYETYACRRATMAAYAAAERIKVLMCQNGAVAADGCLPAALAAWTPVRTLEQNAWVDEPDITFPTIDFMVTRGVVPDMIGANGCEGQFIAFTIEDGNGSAASYVSAEYAGRVSNLRVSFHRQLPGTLPHPSYFHACYAANAWSGQLFTFLLQNRSALRDTVLGDIYIRGNADISPGDVTGTTKATGVVSGDGGDDEISGHAEIPAPDLSEDGPWYLGLQVSADGRSSANPAVITDSADGMIDNKIAGIVCERHLTGENQPYMDPPAGGATVWVLDGNFGVRCGPEDPTYHSGSDATIVTVPPEYNNKALFIPGDFWIDIHNPINIDFRTPDGRPVNLTFIVKGNVYMTDGINNLTHPQAAAGGMIAVIAIKDGDRAGATGNINYGDPSGYGQIDPISAFLYAENDFNWFADAQGRGTFAIFGNMTAGGQIDFTSRNPQAFLPITVTFDPAILNPGFRANLPLLPPDNSDEMLPGSPFTPSGTQYI